MNKVRAAYIHFPFCQNKCPYCDFVSYALRDVSTAGYVDALIREMELISKSEDGAFSAPFDTLYLGGGTPCVFSPEEIERVVQKAQSLFSFSENIEITMEVNPGAVTKESLGEYKNTGINRISLGVQSFSNDVLENIGRIHDATAAVRCITAIRESGFTNFSCDLMTGLPGQSVSSALESAMRLVDLQVPHISHYALTLAQGTPFYQKYIQHPEFLPPEDKERQMHHAILSLLEKNGYHHYEISNCCFPGYESRHNINYWKALPYYGFGCGAHSYYAGKRRANTADICDYREKLFLPDAELSLFQKIEEEISPDEEKKEFILLGLRLLSGVSKDEYHSRFHADLTVDFSQEIASLCEAGLLVEKDACFFIPPDKLDVANLVFMKFV